MPASDAELTRTIRASDRRSDSAHEALEELYRRHRPAVLAYARTCCRDMHTAEDLVSEAFTRTLQAVHAGHGPEYAWRPYLLSVVRRTAADWAATTGRTDLSPDFAHWLETASTEDGGEEHALRQEDNALIVRSFRALPERWQSVLWHTIIEGESAEQVGTLLGIGPSGVGSLAARARDGLREAYLSAHIESGDSVQCRHFSLPLAAAIRRGRRPNKDLARHLDQCPRCRRSVMDLTDLNARMRLVLPGALLGWAAPSYFASRMAHAGTAGGAGNALQHLAKSKFNTLGARVAAATVATVAVGGFLLVTAIGDPATGNSAQPAPSLSSLSSLQLPSSSISSTSATPSPTAGTTGPVNSPTPTPQLPKAAAVTRLRIKSTDRCMATAGSAGAEPYESKCDGSASQTWELVHDTAGQLQLRNQASKLCLTYPSRLPDGAVVRQSACGPGTRGQWWDYLYSQQDGTLIVNPLGDNSRRLGLNEWNRPGTGVAYSPTIGITLNYYNTPSLVLLVDGKLAI